MRQFATIEIDIVVSTRRSRLPVGLGRLRHGHAAGVAFVDFLPAMAGVGGDPAGEPHRLNAVGT